MRAGRAPEGASVLTIRVSRDGGRVYSEPAAVVTPHDLVGDVDPLAQIRASRWPPCRCPWHREAGEPATS